jgi:hypothetical protein
MSDLAQVLPDFDVGPYSHLLHSLEKHDCTVADLVSIDPVDIARKCPLPLLDLRRLVLAVIQAIQSDLHILPEQQPTTSDLLGPTSDEQQLNPVQLTTSEDIGYIKTLEPDIDALLVGGLPVGYVSEIVGERLVESGICAISLLIMEVLLGRLSSSLDSYYQYNCPRRRVWVNRPSISAPRMI